MVAMEEVKLGLVVEELPLVAFVVRMSVVLVWVTSMVRRQHSSASGGWRQNRGLCPACMTHTPSFESLEGSRHGSRK